MLEAIKLSKSFGDKQALIDLSIRVDPGEILCLLGANGAGKSTTLNLLLNFIEADSGKVIIDGEEIRADDKAAMHNSKQKLVYIPEQVNLYQEFNALENLEYLAQLSGITVNIGQIKQAKDAQCKAKIPNPVHHKRFDCRSIGRWFAIIKPNQKIRGYTNTFPTKKHLNKIVRCDKRQHRECEERQIGKESGFIAFTLIPLRIVIHISKAVKMHQS